MSDEVEEERRRVYGRAAARLENAAKPLRWNPNGFDDPAAIESARILTQKPTSAEELKEVAFEAVAKFKRAEADLDAALSRTDVPAMAREIRRLREENERLQNLIERDKTGMASALNAIRTVAIGYGWIPAGELGSYTAAGCGEGEELTEEVLREEVGRCLDEVRAIAVQAVGESGDRVNAAFIRERDQLRAVQKEVDRLREEARWIPVGERLPEKEGYYYVATEDDLFVTWWSIEGWEDVVNGTVTYWRPMPGRPEVK